MIRPLLGIHGGFREKRQSTTQRTEHEEYLENQGTACCDEPRCDVYVEAGV